MCPTSVVGRRQQPRCYREGIGNDADIAIHGVDASLQGVPNRDTLVKLLRRPLLDARADEACDPARLDAFVEAFLDQRLPGLPYPATLPDQDDLIAIRRPETTARSNAVHSGSARACS